jgi:hypothetical protein
MEWTVQIGFELDIYLPDELAGMYWYLSLLASSRVALVDLILKSTEERCVQVGAASPGKDDQGTRELKKSLLMLRSLKAEAQGTVALASALSSLYVYLSYRGIVQAAARSTIYEPKLKYELRMKPFLCVKSPELPSFEDWHAVWHPFEEYGTGGSLDTSDLATYLDSVDHETRSAKMHFAAMKKLGAAAGGCEGLEDIWSTVSITIYACSKI